MTRKLFFLSALLLVVSLTISGCGKTVGEQVAEKSLEASVGGEADVDIKDDKVTIETEEGVWQAGEDITLPSDWPDDIHVAEGKIAASSVNDLGHSLTLLSDKSVADLKKEYQDQLADDGWEINMSFDMDNNVLLGAEKDGRTLSVSLGIDDGKTAIVIVEGKKQ